MRGLKYLIDDETVVVAQSIRSEEQSSKLEQVPTGPGLLGEMRTPVPLFTTPRVTTAEIVTPSSITERTTNLLE
jgi:hypothetical protein